MAKLDFPAASASPWVAPNNVIYTYIGTSPNGYWEANTANAATNLPAIFVERTGSTMTGALKLDNAGSVSLPDICFDGDINTGLYSPSADSLGIATGGVQRLSIAADGSVVLSAGLTSSSGFVSAQQFLVNAAGSAGSPAYRFGLGSGFFSPSGTDHVAISTASTERLVVDSSGNVGINSTSPSYRLQLGNNTSIATATPEVLSLGATYSNTAGSNPKLRLWDDTTGYMGFGVSSSQIDYICAGTYDHVFHTSSNERMRINSSGNVGIGTSAPLTKCHLDGPNGVGSTMFLSASNLAADAGGSLGLGGNYNGTNRTSWASVDGLKENATSGNYAGYLAFKTRPNGGSNTERMRIDSSGNVAIGDSTPTNQYDRNLNINGANSSSLHLTTNLMGTGNTNGFHILQSSGIAYLWNRENRDMVFGTNSTERMRILNGGGLTFHGDTAQANALDDYEEGTWTPTLSSGTVNAAVNASYTKIGRQVTAYCYIQFTGIVSNSGRFEVRGLPFVNPITGHYGGGTINYAATHNVSMWRPLVMASQNFVYFHRVDGSQAAATMANWVGATALIVQVTYFAT
jgi:hypothetical protein